MAKSRSDDCRTDDNPEELRGHEVTAIVEQNSRERILRRLTEAQPRERRSDDCEVCDKRSAADETIVEQNSRELFRPLGRKIYIIRHAEKPLYQRVRV